MHSLPPSPRFRVALLVETSTQIGRDLLRGIRRYEHENGPWSLYLEPGGLLKSMPRLKKWRGTGMIARVSTEPLFRAVVETGLPAVVFTPTEKQKNLLRTLPKSAAVHVDAAAVSAVAAAHLVERGFAHFAFVGHPESPDWCRRRERGFADYLSARGRECHVYSPPPASRRDWGSECRRLAAWLSALPKPVGVMATNDARGREVMEACVEAGLRVPDEVAVIGVDNDDLLCELCDPPLSSIALATEEAGYETAALLHRMMRGRGRAYQEIGIRPAHLIVRRSTETAVAASREVIAARQYIFEHAHELIQVADVARHAGLPRRTLETRFKQSVGHGILKELIQVRIERVKSMLMLGGEPVSDISKKSGFANANYLSKAFRHVTGCSPRAYRQKFGKAA